MIAEDSYGKRKSRRLVSVSHAIKQLNISHSHYEMKFLEYTCFKPPQNTFSQSKSQCTWSALFGQSPQPAQRSSHAVCVFSNEIFMYGGRGDKGTLNEFWVYHCDTLQWRELSTCGNSPPRLEGHSMVLHSGKIYVFGGETSFASADESPLWQYDIEERMWEKLGSSEAVMAPCGRRQHTAVLHMDAMCIYGGYQDLIGPTKEMWLFDFATKSWHFDVAASCESGPDARYGHCAAVNKQSMWVCGGLTGLRPNSEALAWNFELLVWISIKTKGGPSELSGHAMCMVSNSLFIFGGCNGSGESSSDMWRLSLTDNTWTKCHCSKAVKPPAISGHCLIMYHTPMLFKKTELRTRSFPDFKKKRLSLKTPPTTRRSVSCGKLPNESKYSAKTKSLESNRKISVSDKETLISRQETKVIYVYENPLTEVVDDDVEILPKFEPIPSLVEKASDIPTASFLASTSATNLKQYQTGYISSRKIYGSLAAGGSSLTTFSYNLIEDSLRGSNGPDVLETSFITLPSEDATLQQHWALQQRNSSPRLADCDANKELSKENPFPAITNVMPYTMGISNHGNKKQRDTELESLDRDKCSIDNSTNLEVITPDLPKDTALHFQTVFSQTENNDNFVLLVLGGKVSSSHPNSSKPFSLWQCNIVPASY